MDESRRRVAANPPYIRATCIYDGVQVRSQSTNTQLTYVPVLALYNGSAEYEWIDVVQ